MANQAGRLPLVEQTARWITRGGASVFMFHRILPDGEACYDSELVTSNNVFADFLDWLCDNHTVLPLDDLVARYGKNANDKRPLCAITFDDGWADNYTHALPLLRQRRIPATIFLPVRFIGTDRRFWQEKLWLCTRNLDARRRRELISDAASRLPWFPPAGELFQSISQIKRFLMTRPSQEAEEFVHRLMESAGFVADPFGRAFLNWDEVRQMQKMSISFGSHTLNHVLLTQMEPATAAQEIRQSRQELMERLGEEVSSFSYPWGAASSLSGVAVKESGYGFALTTRPGLVKINADPWTLPRIAASNSILRGGATTFAPGKARLSFAKNVWTSVSPKSANGNKRIKIVFVVDQITDWEGGTERQLHTLIRTLDRTHFEPELCFIFPVRGLSQETLPCPARWVCPDETKVPSSIFSRLFRLAKLLRQMRPQIVQTFFMEGIFAGILAARLSGVPRIVGSARNAGYWKKARHRIAFRSVAGLAHRWQCNSRALWEYVRKSEGVSPERIEILPNAIDLSQFTPAMPEESFAMRRQLRIGEAGPVFVTVAALTPVKDISTLIEAAKLLEAHLPTAQYLLVGEGPLREELQQQVERLGLNRAIHFVGRQVDVRPYLAAANFGVLTSRSEGSSNSVLEYMAMGLPSVVSDIASNHELVSGVFFAPGDAGDLAQKLMTLTQDAALRNQLRSQYIRTASEFSMEKFVTRTQSFYSKLAAEIQ
jgi:glycosyltransferase involved in cell wall biosynthesis